MSGSNSLMSTESLFAFLGISMSECAAAPAPIAPPKQGGGLKQPERPFDLQNPFAYMHERAAAAAEIAMVEAQLGEYFAEVRTHDRVSRLSLKKRPSARRGRPASAASTLLTLAKLGAV
jgi:hypothetical protein